MSKWLPPWNDLLYVAVVAGVGALVLWRAAYWVRKAEAQRRERLAKRTLIAPVSTVAPIDDPIGRAKQRGHESIREQSTVVRRVLYPLIIGGTLAVVAIPFIGKVPAAVVSVSATAVTLLVGIAVRPVVENAFAGLALSMSKLLNIGDTVKVDGNYGTVEDITVTHTTVKIWDWRRYVVPNTKMLQSSVINYSLFDGYLWAYVEFWLAYDTDLELARELALEAPQRSDAWAGHEEPQFWVMEMGKDGYRCWLAAWADNSADAWVLSADVRTSLVFAFRKHGIRCHSMRHEFADGTSAPRLAAAAATTQRTDGEGDRPEPS